MNAVMMLIDPIIQVPVSALSEAARRLVENEATANGLDVGRAVAKLLNRTSEAERRRAFLETFPPIASRVALDSVDLIREDRDGR